MAKFLFKEIFSVVIALLVLSGEHIFYLFILLKENVITEITFFKDKIKINSMVLKIKYFN